MEEQVSDDIYRQFAHDSAFWLSELQVRQIHIPPSFREALPATATLLSTASVYDCTREEYDDERPRRRFDARLFFWSTEQHEIIMWLAYPPPSPKVLADQRCDHALTELWGVLGGVRCFDGERVFLNGRAWEFFRFPLCPIGGLMKPDWNEVLEDSLSDASEIDRFLDSLRLLGVVEGHRIVYRVDTGEVLLWSEYNDNPLRSIGLKGEELFAGNSLIYTIEGVGSITDLIELISRRTLAAISCTDGASFH